MENGPLICDVPIKTSINRGFSIAMFDYQRILEAKSNWTTTELGEGVAEKQPSPVKFYFKPMSFLRLLVFSTLWSKKRSSRTMAHRNSWITYWTYLKMLICHSYIYIYTYVRLPGNLNLNSWGWCLAMFFWWATSGATCQVFQDMVQLWHQG